MKIKEFINDFQERNNVKYTFYNKFLDAYSFCFSYYDMGVRKNLSFIIMQKDEKIRCILKFSMFQQTVFEDIKSLNDLESVFSAFINIARQSGELKLEEAA